MREFDPRRFGDYATPDYTRAKSVDDYQHMFVIHLPGEERMAGRVNKVSPLHDTLKAKGGIHMEVFGWERPKWFSLDGREEKPGFGRTNAFEAIARECQAVRERVGMLDLSSFAKYDVTGPDAASFLDRILANRVPRKVGGIALAHMLGEGGRIENEFTVTRLAEDRFYLLSAAVAELRDLDFLTQRRRAGERVEICNVTDDYGVLVVAGPKSREVLAKLTKADLTNAAFRWLTGKEIEVDGIKLRALRVNYVGELGWELHVPMDGMADVYRQVWQAGSAHGIADFGVYAVNSLRMEKAYRGWGGELTNEISPVEADLMRFVDLEKGDFIGRQGVRAHLAKPMPTRLVYLEVAATKADAIGGEAVFAGGRCIGVTTSGGYGHAVKKSLAFAYVSPEFTQPGTKLEIEILNDRRPATILAEPAYDPGNQRLRA
jgi:dimethylglycine dehydrogenase